MTDNRRIVRVIALALSFLLIAMSCLQVSSFAEEAEPEKGSEKRKLHDGYFVGTGFGKYSHVKIAVKVERGIITALRVLFHEETPSYWDMAKVTFKWILEKQGTDVDSVSTATKSCRAIREAVKGALDNSEMNNQAGDPDAPESGWFAGGDGSSEDPFMIMNKGQLIKFARNMTDTVDYDGYHVKLGTDIDLSGYEWTPCGDGACSFEGEFDGAGHVITGLTSGVKGSPVKMGKQKYAGLFGVLGSSAYVHDLTIKNASINVVSSGDLEAGILSGSVRSEANQPDIEVYTLDDPEGKGPVNQETYEYGKGARIKNCSVSGSVRASSSGGDSFAGGLIGKGKGARIINTRSTADVESVAGGYYSDAGGISGSVSESLIANSYARGSVKSTYGSEDTEVDAGLLAGSLDGYALNSYTSGDVITEDPEKSGDIVIRRGEIAGSADKENIVNCIFSKDGKAQEDGTLLTEPLNAGRDSSGEILKTFDVESKDLAAWVLKDKAELTIFEPSEEEVDPGQPVPDKPAKVKGLKAKTAKKKLKISWKGVKDADGYEIVTAKDRKFKKNVKKFTASGNVRKFTVKRDRKWNYVRIRAVRNYEKTDDGKTIPVFVYGPYSKPAKIR